MIPSHKELCEQEYLNYKDLKAREMVITYANLVKSGPELTHDGVLRHSARLDVLKYSLPNETDEDKLQAYLWLISEKQKAEDIDDYENAEALKKAQEDLEDKLHNFKNNELYICLEEFYETQNLSKEYLSRSYEKTLLANLELNQVIGDVEVSDIFFQLAVLVGTLKNEKEDFQERFYHYFTSRDNYTRERHKLGLRRNTDSKK